MGLWLLEEPGSLTPLPIKGTRRIPLSPRGPTLSFGAVRDVCVYNTGTRAMLGDGVAAALQQNKSVLCGPGSLLQTYYTKHLKISVVMALCDWFCNQKLIMMKPSHREPLNEWRKASMMRINKTVQNIMRYDDARRHFLFLQSTSDRLLVSGV